MTLGFIQAIVYAGAIMILFLFVIWLLNLQAEAGIAGGRLARRFFGAIAAAALMGELFAILSRAPSGGNPEAPAGYGSIHNLAMLLFSDYLVAFEITSLLLLAAVVGSIALARRPAGARWRGRTATRGGEPLTMVPTGYYMALSAALFAIGVAGVVLRRNVIVMFMSIELMLNAVNLAFVALGRGFGTADGQVIVFFVITVAAAEAAVGLAIMLAIFRSRETINADELNLMRW